jgi:hypothetical protein
MTRSIAWDKVAHADVLRAIQEYDRLGPERFFSAHGFAPTTTYDLVWDKRRYPPKAILGTAYEFATAYRDEGAGCLTRRALLDDLGLGPDDLDPILADLTDEGVIQPIWTPGGRAYRALDGGQ